MSKVPFNAASSNTYYSIETEVGVLNENPVWTLLRNTGGMPVLSKDPLQSAEKDGSREIKSIRMGNQSVTGEFSTELAFGAHDDLYANAVSSDWLDGFTETGVEITVDSSAKTFTRSTGSFISDGVEVGTHLKFSDLTGNNAIAFMATEVTANVITGSAITIDLTDETVTTDYTTADSLRTGNLCKSMSIMTVLRGKCGTEDLYIVSTGVEFGSWSLELSVQAQVTGSFTLIGRKQLPADTTPPTGSTYAVENTNEPFINLDGKVSKDGELMGGITTLSFSNDNSASAQFDINSKSVYFVERGEANNSLSASMFMFDAEILNGYINDDNYKINLGVILHHDNGGSMSFNIPRAVVTGASPELSDSSVNLSLEGTGIGDKNNSSLVIQRLA